MDRQLNIIGANHAYLKSTGRVEADLLGRYLFDAFPENPDEPDSTNVAEVRASLLRAIATGEPDTTAFLRYSVPRETAAGTVFDERFWSTVHTPIRGADGAVGVRRAERDRRHRPVQLRPRSRRPPRWGRRRQSGASAEDFNRAQMHEAMSRILSDERSHLRNLFNQAPGFIAVVTGEQQRVRDRQRSVLPAGRAPRHHRQTLAGSAAGDARPGLRGAAGRGAPQRQAVRRARPQGAAAAGRRRAGHRSVHRRAVPADVRPGWRRHRHLRAGPRRQRRPRRAPGRARKRRAPGRRHGGGPHGGVGLGHRHPHDRVFRQCRTGAGRRRRRRSTPITWAIPPEDAARLRGGARPRHRRAVRLPGHRALRAARRRPHHLDRRARQGALRRRRRAGVGARRHARHHRAHQGGGRPARRPPPQGRIPGDAGARTAQSARADQFGRAAADAPAAGRRAPAARHRHHRAPGRAHHRPGGRPDRRLARHARADLDRPAAVRHRRASSSRRSNRCAR